MKCEKIDTYQIFIADISHHRHHRRWCTFFQAGVLFSLENAKFWPILTNLGYFVANLRTFLGTFYRPN